MLSHPSGVIPACPDPYQTDLQTAREVIKALREFMTNEEIKDLFLAVVRAA